MRSLSTSPAARLLLAVAIPTFTLLLQWTLWPLVSPYVWFLFYPATYVAALLTGLGCGIVATLLSALYVGYFFIPPQWSFALERPTDVFSIAVFLFTGVAFSVVSARTRKLAEGRAVEATLRESEVRYRSIFENSLDGVLLTTPDGGILAANRRAQEMLGYGEAELRALGRAAVVDPDDPRLPGALAEREATGRFRGELTWVRRDGTRFPGEVSSLVFQAEDGRRMTSMVIRDLTQKKRDEQALRDSETRFAEVFRSSPLAIGIARLTDDALVDVNPAFEALYGHSRDEAIGRTTLALGLWPVPEERAQLLAAIARSGRVASYEARFRDKAGRLGTAQISGQIVALQGENHLVAIVADVTGRKRDEVRLRQLSEAVEQSSESVLITGLDASIEYVNAAFTRATGYAYAEVVGRNPRFLNSGKTPADNYQSLWRTLLEGNAWHGEFHNRRKDGSEYAVLAKITPIRGDDGRITHYVAIEEDITEKKRSAEQLDRYRHHLEELVEVRSRELSDLYDHAPCGYHSVDARGIVTRVNATELDLLGYSKEEFVGKRITAFLTESSKELHARALGEFLKSGSVRNLQLEFLRKDGSALPVVVDSDLVRDPDGGFAYTRTTLVDNTERKENDRLLAVMQAELSRRAQDAEAANVAKSAFLANMSHEIRTPINGVLGMAHLLHLSGVTPKQAHYLQRIEASGQHLLGVINDILDLSKIEAGKIRLDPQDFPLSALIDGVAAITKDRIREKGLRFRLDIAGVPASLHGDKTRLTQALVNYLSNATKFTETGEIKLRIRLIEESRSDYLLRFAVIDSGIGIAADVVPRLFNSFEQADNSITRKYGGTGLGLALTRKLAELMGGHAGVESTLGGGSTFWFTARLGKGPALAADERAVEPIDAEAALKAMHAGTRVLLAEDDPINREVAECFLQGILFQVDIAEDGAVALDKAAANDYDLILMDMQMPGMGGIEATRAIRALPGKASIPIVALTANAFPEHRERCLAAGMNDFLAKPIEPDVLFPTLLKWL